ncbi:MAG: LamG-like jellyroll fold domain-containing protein [Hyphomicrobium sp.]|jgi:hypothetical protein
MKRRAISRAIPSFPRLISSHFHKTFRDVLDDLSLTGSLKLCLDATDIESYEGQGQVWRDRSGNGYDFNRGVDSAATAADPTFNGIAGRRSRNEYFSFDGGDLFTYDSANEAWMNNIHKDNAKFTIAGWVQFPSVATYQTVCATEGFVADIGFILCMTNSAKLQFNARYGASLNTLGLTSVASISAATWTFVAVTVDDAIGVNGAALVINGTSQLFTSTYATPSASAAVDTFRIGARGTSGIPLLNGARMGGLVAWEGVALTTTQLASIYAATRGRFGV